jgi:hypothetical protein
MKRRALKLDIRRETLRALAGMELSGVDGGTVVQVQRDTRNLATGCPFVAEPPKP